MVPMNRPAANVLNRATCITASVLGTVVALSGMHHGYFEILQGNKATEYMIIQSIAPEHQRWTNGEEAFTLIPNFLVTGIIAVLTSIAIMIWSLRFLHTPYGPSIFIILFVFLTFTGGGIGHILFFVPVWLFSRRIRREISWRGVGLGNKTLAVLSNGWIYFLVITALLFILALEVSVFGIPGMSDKTIYTVIYVSLLSSLVTLHLAFMAAFVRDIESSGQITVNNESYT